MSLYLHFIFPFPFPIPFPFPFPFPVPKIKSLLSITYISLSYFVNLVSGRWYYSEVELSNVLVLALAPDLPQETFLGVSASCLLSCWYFRCSTARGGYLLAMGIYLVSTSPLVGGGDIYFFLSF